MPAAGSRSFARAAIRHRGGFGQWAILKFIQWPGGAPDLPGADAAVTLFAVCSKIGKNLDFGTAGL